MGHYCRICGRTRANEKFSGAVIELTFARIASAGRSRSATAPSKRRDRSEKETGKQGAADPETK